MKLLRVLLIFYTAIAIIKLYDIISAYINKTGQAHVNFASAAAPKAKQTKEEKKTGGGKVREKLPPPKFSKDKPEESSNARRECNTTDIEVLQTLSKRREELTQWEKQAKEKEAVLIATQAEIEVKIGKLNNLKKELQDLLATYDDKHNEQILELVKIYETMKPKEAAVIFDKLEDEVLIPLAARMKESKMAAILGKMDPDRAREVTILLSEKKSVALP